MPDEIGWQLDTLTSEVGKTNALMRAMLRVLLEGEEMSATRKIEILDSAGLRPLEIANILGMKPQTVSTLKLRTKKRG
ncbi:MAG: hypothetical protein ABSB53_01595 [Nitrososphaerales archaeon]